MKRFYSLFDGIGEFITSMAIVIIILVPFMWYRYYEFNTLFVAWLPIEDLADQKDAAHKISLVCITLTVVFMVNTKRMFPGVKLILVAVAFVLNVFFWSMKEGSNIYFVLFISAVIAGMDYGIAHLFDAMWRERNLVPALKDLLSQFEDVTAKLTAARQELATLEPQIQHHKELIEKCTCPDCKRIFTSPEGVNAHKCKSKTVKKS